MTINIPQNFYKQTVAQDWSTGTGNFYVSVKPTKTQGYITVSSASATLREIIYFTATGTDGTGDYITISTGGRGKGGTTEQTHIIGETVRMNVSAETIQEISDDIDAIVAAGAPDASTTTKGITRLSVDPVSATIPIAVGTNDVRVPTADPTTIFAIKKFGGTGADGALAITSGATNIDLGSAAVVVKNYTSISITGTGSLTFTNPHTNGTVIILKSQGAVTLTSSTAPMINASNCGAAGGAGASDNTTGGGGTGVTGESGSAGLTFDMWSSTGGGGGINSGAGGAGGVVLSVITSYPTFTAYSGVKYNNLFLGAGGGGGEARLFSGSGTCIGGTGGRGGGSLILECGGAFNFTTASGISVGGSVGTAGVAAGTSGTAGGGGGGGGGMLLVLYNTLTANSGTVTITGGTGGDGDSIGGNIGAGGGGGGSKTAGTQGTSGTTDPDGGTGGDGFSLVAANTEFA